MAEELSRALELLRTQRHHFMNHLQVISGWLQLGKAERAIQYIDRVAARMEAERQALRRLERPEAALFVLDMGLRAESYGVALEWRLTGPVDPAALPEAAERVAAALEQASHLPEGARRLVITLGSTIDVLHTSSSVGEG